MDRLIVVDHQTLMDQEALMDQEVDHQTLMDQEVDRIHMDQAVDHHEKRTTSLFMSIIRMIYSISSVYIYRVI